MEHGPIDIATVHAMVAATRGTEATPIVRVPWTEHWLVKPVLDTGAMGINFPMISSVELARAGAAALRYPPDGVRGVAPSYAPVRWGLGMADYLKAGEQRDAERHHHRGRGGGAQPGCDPGGAGDRRRGDRLVRPVDEPGRAGAARSSELTALVGEAEVKVKRAGIPLAGVALTAEAARAKRTAGYQMLLVGFDVQMVEAAARGAVAAARGS